MKVVCTLIRFLAAGLLSALNLLKKEERIGTIPSGFLAFWGTATTSYFGGLFLISRLLGRGVSSETAVLPSLLLSILTFLIFESFEEKKGGV